MATNDAKVINHEMVTDLVKATVRVMETDHERGTGPAKATDRVKVTDLLRETDPEMVTVLAKVINRRKKTSRARVPDPKPATYHAAPTASSLLRRPPIPSSRS
jgi:hypothetical protein